jgi:fructosamine-3-kinase
VRPDDPRLAPRVEKVTGKRPARVATLPGGCIAQVYKVELAGGGALVAKLAPGGGLAEEGRMLADLARLSDLPVPAVMFAADDLLLLDYVESGGRLDGAAERHAAELLAALHGITGPAFGYERDTLIGPLRQPNPWSESWLGFFREQRLLHLGRLAREAGHLAPQTFRRLEALCGKLDSHIEAPAAPALLHGDLWDGNILVRDGRIAAFLDPAIYYGHPEIELAFTTLFGTFGDAFFARYNELRPLAPGFFEVRRDLYNLYPLLVHTALFGGHYGAAVERILRRFA